MKYFRILMIAGTALEIAGIIALIFWAPLIIKGEDVVSVPAGAGSYGYITVDMPGGGPVSGTFESTTGSVEVSVMDAGQFNLFKAGSGDDSRVTKIGESGTFSVTQVDMEKCFIVVRHALGLNVSQEARVTYEIASMRSTGSTVAAALIVAGVAITATTILRKSMEKSKAAEQAHSKYIDVVFFEDERHE